MFNLRMSKLMEAFHATSDVMDGSHAQMLPLTPLLRPNTNL